MSSITTALPRICVAGPAPQPLPRRLSNPILRTIPRPMLRRVPRPVLRLLPRLLAGVALVTAAGAGQAQQEASAPATKPATGLYKVVNLRAGDLSELPAINTRDQVSFSLHTAQGSRGYFYDGKAVRDIGTLGGPTTNAVGLNNAGQVTGGSATADGSARAFVWSAGAGMVNLGKLPGASESDGAAINNRGVVTGYSHGVPVMPPRAFRWSAADGIQDLGAFTGGLASFSAGTALNDDGLIAGNSDASASDRHAFAWTRARGMVDIDSLRSVYSEPVAVGSAGLITGHYVVPKSDNLYHAFVWTAANGMRDMGTAGGTESFVLAMSPNAHAAGVINVKSGDQHAMSWTQSGGMVDLGTLDGAPRGAASRALGVNSKGQIVGWSRNKAGLYQPFLWSAKGGMVELNKRLHKPPAGLVVEEALAISDNGAIVAGSNAGLVLLTPCCASNGSHAVGPVVAPDLVEVGKQLDASVSFADDDAVGIRQISWSWGDGTDAAADASAQTVALKEERGGGSASSSHRYTAPGIYPVTATVVNRAGQSVSVSRQVIVYAPGAGIVGGNGAIMSPQGAIKTAMTKAGKASFRFVAPSSTGQSTAASTGQLRFGLAGWTFRSEDLRPMAGAGVGQFEGSGTVNGRGDYKFTLSTTAGAGGRRASSDAQGSFNLKVWQLDPKTQTPVVVYDSQVGAPRVAAGAITDGEIVQH
jgi:probable HAF family extracellular repeat protein